jgi:hypothetical protein
MRQVKFIRSTHENGRFRPFSTEAYQFWLDHGWIVGEVLRPEQGMGLFGNRCGQEYLLDHPESEMLLPVSEAHLAWCLIKLLEYGMACVVAEPVNPAKDI